MPAIETLARDLRVGDQLLSKDATVPNVPDGPDYCGLCAEENRGGYVVVENTPGYLPDDAEPWDEGLSYREALRCMLTLVRSYCEERLYHSGDEPSLPLEVWFSRDSGEASVSDPNRMHDLGRVWCVVPWDEG